MTLPRWTPEEDAILCEQWMIATANEISVLMNRSIYGVKGRAKKLGLPYHKTGRPNGAHSEYHRKHIETHGENAVVRDPFIAILFGACEAIKATMLPSRVYTQPMNVNDDLEAA